MKQRSFQIACLLFCSGLCALVYQTTWLREFRMIFGASTAASAAVLAIFMGGLGAGSWLLGSRADRAERPLEFYANLELVIAISSAVTPLLLFIARLVYTGVGGSAVLGATGGTIVRLLLSAIVLSIPTIAMGGTLPAAARAAETDQDASRRNLALLYGLNTLGAVTGATLSTFFLFETFGNRKTLWLACLLNGLVALVARALARGYAEDDASNAAGDPADALPIVEASEADAQTPVGSPASAPFVLFSSGLVGFAFLLMEIVWYRMLGPILGGTSFTFGLILAVALFGIGVGGAAYAAFFRRRQATVGMFGLTCALEAVFIALPYALGDRVAILAALLRPLGNIGFSGHVAAWIVVTSIVLLPAAFVAGIQFPILISLLGRGRTAVGQHVGHAYAANTLGAILGSLVGGFGILPLLTAPGTWRLVVVLLVLLGAVAVLAAVRTKQRLAGYGPTAVAIGLALILLTPQGPTAAWRHSPIGAGRVDLADMHLNDIRSWVNSQRRSIAWEADGVESCVGLRSSDGYSFVVNGKIDGHARGDAATQVMSGLLGALLHPNPRTAMVVGLGTGSTAGWLGADPAMERVDVVELEPAILHVAEACAPVNQDVLHNPKVHITIGDAREVLITTPNRYDVIFSEPSNPYRAGVASLFTHDFYQSVSKRLGDGGIFVQWMQAYEIDGQALRTIVATLASTFPHVEIWHSLPADLLFVASMEPISHDITHMRERIAQEPYRSALANAFRATTAEDVLGRCVARSTLAREILEQEGDAINTDDQNIVEFAFARSVGKLLGSQTDYIFAMAEERSDLRPDVGGGPVDWDRAEQARITSFVLSGRAARIPANLSGEQLARAQMKNAYLDGHYHDVAEAVRHAAYEPKELYELEMYAECFARDGDERAVPYIDEVRKQFPPEGDALLGVLRCRQGRYAEATDAFVTAFTAYRTDPWPEVRTFYRALEVARELAVREPTGAAARRIYDVLGEPFCLHLQDEARIMTRFAAARVIDRNGYGEATREVLRSLEPNVVWTSDFLLARMECYRALGDPLAPQALRDVEEFAANETTPFSRGLTPGGE